MDRFNFPVSLGGQKPEQVIPRLAVGQFPHRRPPASDPGKESQLLTVAPDKPRRP